MDPHRGARGARHDASPNGYLQAARQQTHQPQSSASDAPGRQRNQRLQVTPETRRTPDHRHGASLHNPFRLRRLRGIAPPHEGIAVAAGSVSGAGAGARVGGNRAVGLDRVNINHRASMPFDHSEGSDSEPDLSHLAMFRRGNTNTGAAADADDQQHANGSAHAQVTLSDDEYGGHQSSVLGHDEEEEEDELAVEDDDEMEDDQDPAVLIDPASMGLKEISNLGKFTVSSHKQGNGIEELRNDDVKLFWQSDGPQPHKLTVYFIKRVGIRDIRFYVDYGDDESYTPTKIIFKSGTSENNLIEFAAMSLDSPVGWQQVPIAGAGGGPDGNTLVSYVLQMQILENHQNGKDTHLRGIKIYAFDADAVPVANPDTTRIDDSAADISTATVTAAATGTSSSRLRSRARDNVSRLDEISRTLASTRLESGDAGFPVPDFMRDPEIR